ncbi:MAG: hypothetical protein L3K09_06780, partial [Thermoplasmata archaeon]|nr:hypothetical protein [Thermoplasmata archaeon]
MASPAPDPLTPGSPAHPQAAPAPAYLPPPPPAFLYPPPARPAARDGWVVAVVIGVVAVVIVVSVVVGYLLTSALAPTTQVVVTGVNWNIAYTGATSGYFGPTPQSACNSCPVHWHTATVVDYTLRLTSSAALFDHQVNSIDIQFPFTETSISPSLPLTIAPGATATFTLTIVTP